MTGRDPRAVALEEQFGGWHVWRTRSAWWATRTGRDAQWRDATGVPMTVDAGDEAGLRAALAGYREG